MTCNLSFAIFSKYRSHEFIDDTHPVQRSTTSTTTTTTTASKEESSLCIDLCHLCLFYWNRSDEGLLLFLQTIVVVPLLPVLQCVPEIFASSLLFNNYFYYQANFYFLSFIPAD
jgi:hypothetical protein